MAKLKLSVCVDSLRQPFRKALLTVRQMGAEAVQFEAQGDLAPGRLSRTGVREIRKLLDDAQLRVSALGFHTPGGYTDPERLDQRAAATKAALEFAYSLGAPLVIVSLGPLPAEADSPRWNMVVEVLAELGEHANRSGARLVAETGDQPVKHLAELLARLPEGSLGADLNPGRLLANGFALEEAIEALGRHVLAVHATDARSPAAGRPGAMAPLGQGDVDVPWLLAALEDYAYRGFFTVSAYGMDDPAEEIAQAIRFLRRF